MKNKNSFLLIVLNIIFCFFIIQLKSHPTFLSALASCNICCAECTTLLQKPKQQNLNTQKTSNYFDFSINLTYNSKQYKLNLNFLSNIHTVLDFKYMSNRKLNYQNIVKTLKKIRRMGFSDKTAFSYVFSPLMPQIEQIVSSINTLPVNATINFDKTSSCFVSTKDVNGLQVDTNALYTDIINSLLLSNSANVDIKTKQIPASISRQEALKATKKQSTFSTYYGASKSERKNNIKIACTALHGYKIEPGEIFSFNEAIGKRSVEAGYKEANIIKDGEFVKGVGGGVCQVSTTLYNALLLANIKPCEVHKHSLPVSYVQPALDAMVSWNTADLKFKNNTSLPIFITSSCNGSNLTFNIYGNTKEENTQIKTVSQIVKTIPHKGDKIVPDTQGKYLNKIMFKGEYLREKSPKDGYIAHAYLDTYKNGSLISHQLIREVMYEPQLGLVYEGTEDLPEGMTLPDREN